MKKLLTLCIVHQSFDKLRTPPHPRVLLGMKKRGFGAGRWNGFGGKVEPGETIQGAAQRELREEASLEAGEVVPIGVLDFSWLGKPDILQVHIFKAVAFKGEPKESDEMRPQWFHIDEIPFGQMWQDDKYWMPLFLKDKKFKGKFVFDDSDSIINHELTELKEI